MKHLGMALAATVAMSSLTHAEPGPTATKLMNEPVTVFHYGINRLSDKLDAEFEQHPSNVFYDWQKNRIIITFYLRKAGEEEAEKVGIDEACRTFFTMIRQYAYLNEKGEAYDKEGSRMAQYFLPIGYTNNVLEGIGKEIDQMIVVNFRVLKRNYSAPLLGTGFSVGSN